MLGLDVCVCDSLCAYMSSRACLPAVSSPPSVCMSSVEQCSSRYINVCVLARVVFVGYREKGKFFDCECEWAGVRLF